MTEEDVFKISERLCERGLLRCTTIERGTPRFELTLRGWLALLRLERTGQ